MKALLIEPDLEASEEIGSALKSGGFSVESAEDSVSAFNCLICARFDIIVLNHALHDRGGQRLYDRFHAAGLPTPILLIAEPGEEIDNETILNVTKDSILPKPVEGHEALSWARALVDFNNIMVEFMDFPAILKEEGAQGPDSLASRTKKDVELTDAEKKLLGYFLKNRGKTVYKSDILRSVWNTEEEEVFTNIVEVYITRLRRKLGAHGKKLLNIRGVGYRFEI